MSHDGESDTLLSAEEDVGQFFRSFHGRRMPALSETYPLPVDADEEKRQELHHRQIKFIFSGKNYMGPVKEALQFGEKRRSTFCITMSLYTLHSFNGTLYST
jgi:hypothetical protein